jgi:hypothetical protein
VKKKSDNERSEVDRHNSVKQNKITISAKQQYKSNPEDKKDRKSKRVKERNKLE